MAKYDLETIRHSAAHLMAQAIIRVFPEQKIQLGIGPTIESGFYYDIEMEQKITEEDFAKIEAMMNTIIQEKHNVVRKELPKEEALDFFNKTGQQLKIELIEGLPAGEVISCYSQGEFDLAAAPCRKYFYIPPF
jgi:threonyl-tRNA synthetase